MPLREVALAGTRLDLRERGEAQSSLEIQYCKPMGFRGSLSRYSQFQRRTNGNQSEFLQGMNKSEDGRMT